MIGVNGIENYFKQKRQRKIRKIIEEKYGPCRQVEFKNRKRSSEVYHVYTGIEIIEITLKRFKIVEENLLFSLVPVRN